MKPLATETGRDGLMRQIFKALRLLGYEVHRMHPTLPNKHRLGRTGTFDCYVLGFGWGEVKLPGEKLSPAQREWQERAEALGEHTAVWHSVGQAVREVRAKVGHRR